MDKYNKIIFKVLVFTVSSFFLLFVFKAEAAVLYLESSETEYQKDDVFILEVKMDTENERINAVRIELNFPKEKLEAINTSKGNSILTFWPEDPVFSNESGTVSFIGGVSLGFRGDEKLLSVPFRVISGDDGSINLAEITFSENSVALLNDGLGTEALLELKGKVLTLLPEVAEFPKDEWEEKLEKDDIPPEPFEIMLMRDPLIFGGKYFIAFFATDIGTGIDYCEVKEGDRDWEKTISPYLLKDQALKSVIKVKAVDKKGNERTEELIPPFFPEPFHKNILFLGIIILIITFALLYTLRRIFLLKKKYKA